MAQKCSKSGMVHSEVTKARAIHLLEGYDLVRLTFEDRRAARELDGLDPGPSRRQAEMARGTGPGRFITIDSQPFSTSTRRQNRDRDGTKDLV